VKSSREAREMALVLYTELKYKRIDCYGLSFLTYTGEINEENYPRVLPYPKAEEGSEEPAVTEQDKSEVFETETEEAKFELDVEFLKALDPKAWKDQDHYAVLGLQNSR
jgi:hypothetical protein